MDARPAPPSRTFAVIPVGSLEGAKSRLGETLDAEERHDLALRMARRTIEAAAHSPDIDEVLVVTPDAEVRELALAAGARPLRQRSQGLNRGLGEAREEAVAAGADALLVLPIDLPRVSADAISDVLAPLRDPRRPLVVIVPDRHGRGKSGLGSSNWTARSRSTSTPPTISSWCRRSCPVPSMPSELRVIALEGVPEVRTGDDLAALLNDAIARTPHAAPLREDDVLVVTQKVVSKAEGAIVDLSTVRPRPEASEFARRFDRDARQVEVVLREARRVVRMEQGVLITETEHGFVCANGGVDASNVGPDSGSVVTLLPRDPDASAARIREGVRERTGVDLPVVVSDSFGRPWRWGIVDVAIGVSGLAPLDDLRGSVDHDGRPMRSTVRAIADELASAAELVLGKTAGRPAAVVRGAGIRRGEGSIREMVMPPENDLFR